MPLRRTSTILLFGAIAGLLPSTAHAQTANYTSAQASGTTPVQLSYHANANKNCTAAVPPPIHVTEPPKNGTLIVRKGELATDKVAGCPGLKTPAEVVFYQAKAGYAGPDHVHYEVTGSNGEITAYDVSITVKAGAPQTVPQGRSGTQI
jgi:hypothetical protein